MQAYEALTEHFKKLGNVHAAASILNWDSAVVMPKGSAAGRGEQLATLSGLAHQMEIDPRIEEWLDSARAETGLDDWQQANLREIERRFRQSTALPQQLVEEMSRATSACEMIWRDARAENDFNKLRPSLDRVIELTREAANLSSAQSGLSAYDALLDQFQPGLLQAEIDPIFDQLAAELPAIIDKAIAVQQEPLKPKGPFAKADQKALAEELMGTIGFDFNKGRLDESTHPFSGGAAGDFRITTRYNENDVASGLMGVLHETGHALYEAGLPHDAYPYQPVADARGMALHESQSLFMEMQLSRSDSFIRYLSTSLTKRFGGDPALAPGNLRTLYRHVSRGLIRVDADEVTYPLHIILRYRLERDIIKGNLRTADLPDAWNEGMRNHLGIEPDSDHNGVMQDIHWPVGAFGYFPSYTLGALIAAQLFKKADADLGGIEPLLDVGDFKPIMSWLDTHIHKLASKLPFDDLIIQASGEPLAADAFLAHVRKRYLAE